MTSRSAVMDQCGHVCVSVCPSVCLSASIGLFVETAGLIFKILRCDSLCTSGFWVTSRSAVTDVIDGLQHLLSNASGGLDVLRGVLARMVQDKFGDVFEDDQLCVATVVDLRFKLVPFDRDDRRQRTVEATVRAMETMTPSSTASAATSDPPVAVATEQPTFYRPR